MKNKELPTRAIARTGTAGKSFHHDGRLTNGAESPNVSLPIIHMVGHGDGMICARILARITAVLVLRAATLLPLVNIISAAIAVHSADKRATVVAKITDVPL